MKKLTVLFAFVLISMVFLHFGRSIYMPLLHKVKEKQTVSSVVDQIEMSAIDRLQSNLLQAGLTDLPPEILMLAFKEERILQVYAKLDDGLKLLKEYPFTAYSGELGPKLKQGDRQIPEGIYHVEYLNPNSSYHLSIKLSYPNELDRSKSLIRKETDLGGNIFIHGKSATIGCIPIGDEAIEEVFLMTQNAINKQVKVIISPRDFRVNPSYPEINSINWEDQLYDLISTEIAAIPVNN